MLEEAVRVLLAHHAEHQADGLRRPLLQLGQRLRDGLAAGNVVSAVEPQLGARHQQAGEQPVVELLHARRPAHIEQSALDGAVADGKLIQAQGRGDRGAGVGDLVMAHQRRQGQVEQPLRALEHEAPALFESFVVLAPQRQRRPQLSARRR